MSKKKNRSEEVSTGKWGMRFDDNGALIVILYSDPIYGNLQLQDHTAQELRDLAAMFLAEATVLKKS